MAETSFLVNVVQTLEVRDLESVWVELQVKCKRILVGGFHNPPSSSPDYFELLKESIDRACNTDIIDIIITGDFNCNMAQSIPNKMRELMSEYNLSQLISDDTHFREHSSSLLDLILVRNKENILMSGVVDLLIPEQIRYHCPVMGLLKGALSWYGKLTWESAHAWNLIILCLLIVWGMTFIFMVHLSFYAIPVLIYDVMHNITTIP